MKLFLSGSFFIFIFIATELITLGQETEFSFEKDAGLRVVDFWENKGLVVYSGKAFPTSTGENLNEKIRLYNTDLSLLWEVGLSKYKKKIDYPNTAIITSNFIYHFYSDGSPLKRKIDGYHVSQIDPTGKLKEFEMMNTPFKTISFRNSFQRENRIYFPSTIEEEKNKNVCALYSWDETTFETKNLILKLPFIVKTDKDDYHKEWVFAGNKNDTLYYYTKEVVYTKAEQKCNYKISLVNMSGDLLSTFIISALLNDNKIPAPSINPLIGQSSSSNFMQTTSSSSFDGRTQFYPGEPGNYGDIYFDTENNHIYIFGLYSYEFSKQSLTEYEGVFVQKYDIRGKLIWNKNYPFTQALIDQSKYIKTSYFDQKYVDFTVEQNEKLIFSFRNGNYAPGKNLIYYSINPDGSLINIDLNEAVSTSKATQKLTELETQNVKNRFVHCLMVEAKDYAFIFVENTKERIVKIMRIDK